MSFGKAHHRDSHGRLAQCRSLWEAQAPSRPQGRRQGHCRASAGRMVALAVRAASRGARDAFVCPGARWAAPAGSTRGTAGGRGARAEIPDRGPTLRCNPGVETVARRIGTLSWKSRRIFLREAGTSRSGEQKEEVEFRKAGKFSEAQTSPGIHRNRVLGKLWAAQTSAKSPAKESEGVSTVPSRAARSACLRSKVSEWA